MRSTVIVIISESMFFSETVYIKYMFTHIIHYGDSRYDVVFVNYILFSWFYYLQLQRMLYIFFNPYHNIILLISIPRHWDSATCVRESLFIFIMILQIITSQWVMVEKGKVVQDTKSCEKSMKKKRKGLFKK